ncbi:MAG: PspC domain-containing protein [Raoultibacter sp.]
MNQFSHYSKSAQIGIIVGIAFVLFGVWKLLGSSFGFGWWLEIQRVFGIIFSFMWPIALILAGLYLVWAGKTGRLKGVSSTDWHKPFGRSVADRRIAGVCGGIAEYLNIDPTIVRVLAVILFAVNPIFALLAYAFAAILLPQV